MNCSAALDTSCNASLAVKRGPDVIVNERLAARGRHSDRELMPWLMQCLESVNVTLADIEKWTVGTGPGSYSGVRAGIALVRGISRGADAHCRGISSSRALARQCRSQFADGAHIAVLHDARRQQVIASVYKVDGRCVRVKAPPQILARETVAEKAQSWGGVITPHAEELSAVLEALTGQTRIIATEYVDAKELLLTRGAWPSEPAATDASLEPVYARPAVFVPPKAIRAPAVQSDAKA